MNEQEQLQKIVDSQSSNLNDNFIFREEFLNRPRKKKGEKDKKAQLLAS